jgi:hypothetical protein
VKGQIVKRKRTVHVPPVLSYPFQKPSRMVGYECISYRVNVFERGITLPGRTEVSLAATTLCRL